MFEEMIAAIQAETIRRMFLRPVQSGRQPSSGSGWPRCTGRARAATAP
ncbi:MAG: hypothetical protein ACLRWQ_16880 [Flavonifractor plautii]